MSCGCVRVCGCVGGCECGVSWSNQSNDELESRSAPKETTQTEEEQRDKEKRNSRGKSESRR